MLPVNIQANHALVDGFHVAQFFQKFQTLADSVQMNPEVYHESES